MNRILPLALGFAILLGGPAMAQDAARRQAHRAALVEGRKLMEAGEFEAAHAAFGRWGHEMNSDLMRRIAEADRLNQSGPAKTLRRAWLDFFPFVCLNWKTQARSWNKMAFEYLDLLEAGSAPQDESIRQSFATRDDYQRIGVLVKENELTRATQHARALVTRYPRSMFCPAVVLTLSTARPDRPFTHDAITPWLYHMVELGATDRGLMLVRMARAMICASTSDPEELQIAALAFAEIRAMTSLEAEARWALLEEGKALAKLDDEEARKAFRRMLTDYPGSFESREARLAIVSTWLSADDPASALVAARELEKLEPGGTAIAAELFAISKAWFQKAEYDQSLLLLKEITRKFPKAPIRAKAEIGLGEVYEKLGDEEHMVEAYRRAADLNRVETTADLMDASDTANRAMEFLGNHFMEKGDFEEALGWWLKWEPQSWCGTCDCSMDTRRLVLIATCRHELGKTEEAIATLVDLALRPGFPSADASLLYADLMIGEGREEELRKQVREALADPDLATGVEPLEVYLAMRRSAAENDAAALWRFLEDRPRTPFDGDNHWEPLRAADLLLTMPKAAGEIARKHLEADNKELWIVSAWLLGRLKDESAVDLIDKRIVAVRNHRYLKVYMTALMEIGSKPALTLLEIYAAIQKSPHGRVAREVLGRGEK